MIGDSAFNSLIVTIVKAKSKRGREASVGGILAAKPRNHHLTQKSNRRRPDSNRRITVLQTVALGLLATPPIKISFEFTIS